MMVPDFSLIAEIMMFAEGFSAKTSGEEDGGYHGALRSSSSRSRTTTITRCVRS